MKVPEFARELTIHEGGSVQVNIAQMMEILRIENKLLKPMGINLYQVIRALPSVKKKKK